MLVTGDSAERRWWWWWGGFAALKITQRFHQFLFFTCIHFAFADSSWPWRHIRGRRGAVGEASERLTQRTPAGPDCVWADSGQFDSRQLVRQIKMHSLELQHAFLWSRGEPPVCTMRPPRLWPKIVFMICCWFLILLGDFFYIRQPLMWLKRSRTIWVWAAVTSLFTGGVLFPLCCAYCHLLYYNRALVSCQEEVIWTRLFSLSASGLTVWNKEHITVKGRLKKKLQRRSVVCRHHIMFPRWHLGCFGLYFLDQWEKVETCRSSYFVSLFPRSPLKPFCFLSVSVCLQELVLDIDRFGLNPSSLVRWPAPVWTVTALMCLKHHQTRKADRSASKWCRGSRLSLCGSALMCLCITGSYPWLSCISSALHQHNSGVLWRVLPQRLFSVNCLEEHERVMASERGVGWGHSVVGRSRQKCEEKWSQKDKEGGKASHLLFEEVSSGKETVREKRM